MGYRCQASIVWGIPADEVPLEWLDCDSSHYVGYVIACAELSSADEIDNVGEVIAMLDKTSFNEMSAYAVVRPRLFLICRYL